MEYFNKIMNALVDLDQEKVLALVDEGLQKGINPHDIIIKGLTAGMKVIGKKFDQGEMFIPHVMVGAEIVAKSSEKIKPHLKADTQGKGKTVIIGTVYGDVHDLGKNLVATMLSISNFDVIDLGKNISNDKYIEAILANNAQFCYLSALMTTTMFRQEELIKQLKEKGIRNQVKVIVGGAPISQDWARKIGADGYGVNAMDAVKVAQSF